MARRHRPPATAAAAANAGHEPAVRSGSQSRLTTDQVIKAAQTPDGAAIPAAVGTESHLPGGRRAARLLVVPDDRRHVRVRRTQLRLPAHRRRRTVPVLGLQLIVDRHGARSAAQPLTRGRTACAAPASRASASHDRAPAASCRRGSRRTSASTSPSGTAPTSRRLLASAERASDRAIARGLRIRNTPDSRSSALLVRVTRCDQRRPCSRVISLNLDPRPAVSRTAQPLGGERWSACSDASGAVRAVEALPAGHPRREPRERIRIERLGQRRVHAQRLLRPLIGAALIATTGISINIATPWRTLQNVQPSRTGIIRSSRISDGTASSRRGSSAPRGRCSRRWRRTLPPPAGRRSLRGFPRRHRSPTPAGVRAVFSSTLWLQEARPR